MGSPSSPMPVPGVPFPLCGSSRVALRMSTGIAMRSVTNVSLSKSLRPVPPFAFTAVATSMGPRVLLPP